jgi:Gpi18-like mannosyltransferase
MKISSPLVLASLSLIFLLRCGLSLITFNPDSYNNFAWMDSVEQHGWSGLIDRPMGNWAAVNYPPLTLYSFFMAEKAFQFLPHSWQFIEVRAAFYKIPSLLADVMIAWLIWKFAPYTQKWRLVTMAVFLLNPGLFYNSIWWGQIESWAALWCIAVTFLIARHQTIWAVPLITIALLCKQNAAPLILLILIYLWIDRPAIKKLLAVFLLSVSLFWLSYLPLMKAGDTIIFPFLTYINSLAGQPHQHIASANALNWWYLIGLNNQSDTGIRLWGWIMTFSFLGLVGWLIKINKLDRYSQVWIMAAAIFLTTFIFMTRMHERHIYMSIAMLTILLPYFKKQMLFLFSLLSLIGWYSLHVVWAETMTHPPVSIYIWQSWTKFLAGWVILISLGLPLLLIKEAASYKKSTDN